MVKALGEVADLHRGKQTQVTLGQLCGLITGERPMPGDVFGESVTAQPSVIVAAYTVGQHG